MALNASQLNIALRITANAKGAAAEIDKLKNGVGGLSSEFSRLATIAAASLGAAFGARAFIDANASMQSLRLALAQVTGSSAAAGIEFDFVRAESQRLGIELGVAAKSYLNLAASAKGTTLEGRATQSVWSAVAGAMARLGKSSADTDGALLAISQIMSKGTVSAEELRGQLGERLPGAFQIAARSMGFTTAEFGKMLEAGSIASDEFLPKFAAELNKTFGGGSEIDTFNANLARLKNSLTEALVAVGNTGAFGALGSGIKVLAANMDTAVAAGAVFASIYGGRLVSAIASNTQAMVGNAAQYFATRQAAQALAVQEQVNAAAALNQARAQEVAAAAALTEANAHRANAAALGVYGPARAAANVQAAQAATAHVALANAVVAADARMVAANQAVVASTSRMAVASKVGLTALGFLGGPIGAITTALTLGAFAWLAWGNHAESAAEKAKKAMQDVAQQANDIIEKLGKQAQFGSGDLGILREREQALQNEISLLVESSRVSDGARQKLTERRAELTKIEKAIEAIEAEEMKAVGQSVKLNTDWKEIYKERAKDAEKLRDALRTAFTDSLKAEKDYLDQAKKLRTEAAQKPKDSSPQGQASASLDLTLAQMKLDRIKSTAPLKDVQDQAELVRQLAANLDDQAHAQDAVNQSKLAEADALDKAAAAEGVRQKELTKLQAGATTDLAALEKQVKSLEDGAKVPITLEADGVEKALQNIKGAVDAIPSQKVIEIMWNNKGGEKPPGFASGGILPGYGGGDRRLILAEDGEAITRKQAVAYYGRNFMSQLNAMRLPRFANGGIVSSIASSGMSPGGGGLHPVTLNLPGVGAWPMSAAPNVVGELQAALAREALKHGRR